MKRTMNITSPMGEPVTPQAAGAFGEWAVVVELLRRGWIPTNVNLTVKNNKGFDVAAWKGNRVIYLSVKTRRPQIPHWQIGGFSKGEEVQLLPEDDLVFTILVGMAMKREDDQFYVVPTHEVHAQCQLVQREYMSTLTVQGKMRKDIGHWNLILAYVPGYSYGNLKEKWKCYLDNWQSLDI